VTDKAKAAIKAWILPGMAMTAPESEENRPADENEKEAQSMGQIKKRTSRKQAHDEDALTTITCCKTTTARVVDAPPRWRNSQKGKKGKRWRREREMAQREPC
jgi:hypothetical protein